MPSSQFDWGRAVVHFICGAGLGGVLGYGLAVRLEYPVWYGTTLGALGLGLLAGFYTDNFWNGTADRGDHRRTGWF
jgi:hypothetical protein